VPPLDLDFQDGGCGDYYLYGSDTVSPGKTSSKGLFGTVFIPMEAANSKRT
jgi:hypothetical protein